MEYSNAHHASSASLPSSTAVSSLYTLPSTTSKSATWLATTAAIVVALLVLEQSVYRFKKRQLPGSKWTIPIIGKFADSLAPTMDNYKSQWNSGELSAVSVFNIFIVMASSNQYARKILNSPLYAEPCLVNSAKAVLMADNWVFLNGKAHVDYRRGLNSLFTRKAIGGYLPVQEAVARKHFKEWLEINAKDSTPKPIMMPVRAANMDTSLRVFCGDYIPDYACKIINEKYWDVTRALELVNFPLALPGTKVYKAIQARKVAIHWLSHAAHESTIAMAKGVEPHCLLDEWIKSNNEPSYKGRRDFDDRERAMVLFSFLFASQDAMSSGLIYAFQHLADHPDIFAKVKEEQARVRGGNYDTPLDMDMMDQMTYLQAFVKESMRVKPPVVMVPYKTTKAFPINEEYTIPSGSMVIPSFYNSLHDPEVFPEPDVLLPERWLDADSLANANPKNYMVWGAGPHRCIGQEYASMNIAVTICIAIAMFDWEHEVTPQSDEVEIIATLFPADGCKLKLTPRV